MTPTNSNLKGISYLILAMLIISTQGIVVKWLGGSYPVLQMVIFRNLVALPFTLLFFWREGNRGLPRTKQFRLEFIRGIFLFLSYTTAMMGVAALPLAEVEAIRFSGPMTITVLSVFLLGEKVELKRWLALLVGFLGVLLIVRPGSAAFNLGSVFVLASVLTYALTVIATRKLQASDSSATMAYFSSLVYLAAALILTPVVLGIAAVSGVNVDAATPGGAGYGVAVPGAVHPSIAFLLRGWSLPTLRDGLIMGGLGLVWAAWTYFMARAYSLAQASVAAPFEYLSMPINLMWGFLLWRELPPALTWAGAGLTLLSGMLILYMDRKARQS